MIDSFIFNWLLSPVGKFHIASAISEDWQILFTFVEKNLMVVVIFISVCRFVEIDSNLKRRRDFPLANQLIRCQQSPFHYLFATGYEDVGYNKHILQMIGLLVSSLLRLLISSERASRKALLFNYLIEHYGPSDCSLIVKRQTRFLRLWHVSLPLISPCSSLTTVRWFRSGWLFSSSSDCFHSIFHLIQLKQHEISYRTNFLPWIHDGHVDKDSALKWGHVYMARISRCRFEVMVILENKVSQIRRLASFTVRPWADDRINNYRS